tara:strand:+ start:1319 stop:1477 length:159 start_codon:yes stop_codon:yes gene_type:complete
VPGPELIPRLRRPLKEDRDDAREAVEMARMARVVVAGAPHHITQRGTSLPRT